MKNKGFVKFILFVSVLLTLYFSLNIILNNVDHNEYMYVSAGVLLKNGNMIYKDFAFLQTPLLPLIYAIAYKIIPSCNYLLIAKLISFLFFVLSAYLMFRLSLILTKNKIISLILSNMFLLNSVILRISIESSNYISSLFFFLLSVYYIVRDYDQKYYNKYLFVFSGFFLGLSVSTKLYYVLFIIPLVIYMLISQENLKKLINFVNGFIVGIIPIIISLIISFQNFIFYNVKYHILNSELMKTKNVFSSKVLLIKDFFYQLDVLLIISFTIILTIFLRSKMKIKIKGNKILIFLILILIISIVLIIFMSPLYVQYFSSLSFVIFMFPPIIINIGFEKKEIYEENKLIKLSFPVLFFILILMITLNFNNILKKPDFKNLYVNKIYKTSQKLRKVIKKITKKEKNKVFCFIPIIPLEAGQDIYNELSTGSFMYRISSKLTYEEQKRYKTFSSKYLIKQLRILKPELFLIGYKKKYYKDVINYIKNKNFIVVPETFNGAYLYYLIQ